MTRSGDAHRDAAETATGSARLFLALWPDAGVRASLARHRDAWRWNAGASVVRTAQLHLTLRFIGPVSRARLPLLEPDLQVPFDPFDLEMGVPVLWPHGVAVLSPRRSCPGLVHLHQALGGALRRQELPCDPRAFHPHVTLARRAAGAVPPVAEPTLRWPVTGYALMESTLGPQGGYRVLRDYPCG